jgi:hypothetical protein
MAPLFTVLGVVVLGAPAVLPAVLSWQSRATVSRPWLLFVGGIFLSYAVAVALVVLNFSDVGISGVPGQEQSLLNSFGGRAAITVVGYFGITLVALFALRRAFRRTSS